MNECMALSDRMPEVARGSSRWTSEEASHLRDCADCSAEWDIVRGVVGLGRNIEESLDTARVAERVIGTLRAPAPRPSPWRHARWAVPVALAASLLLVLVRPRVPETTTEAGGVTLTLLPEAEFLTDAEIESVIRLIPVADPAEDGVDTLTDEELTLMLEDLES